MRCACDWLKRKQFSSIRSLFRCAPQTCFVSIATMFQPTAVDVVAALGPFVFSRNVNGRQSKWIWVVGSSMKKHRRHGKRPNKKERDLPANKKRQNFALFFRISSRLAEVRSTLLCQRRFNGRRCARVSKLKWRAAFMTTSDGDNMLFAW